MEIITAKYVSMHELQLFVEHKSAAICREQLVIPAMQPHFLTY